MKHLRDKEHDYDHEFPSWVGYFIIGAALGVSLACAVLVRMP